MHPSLIGALVTSGAGRVAYALHLLYSPFSFKSS